MGDELGSRDPPAPRVLVLGASGYVGGRLAPRLLESGYRVRCLARSPRKLAGLGWAREAEIVAGDVLDPASVERAVADVDVVCYLVHSMDRSGAGAPGADFARADRTAARTVATAAARSGVRRIVYLGGLGEVDGTTSAHLRSRAEVGRLLAEGPVPTTVLRAAMIIGSGSASFEMLRHLVEKLPVMIVPRWVHTRVQPIAIRDVLRFLLAAVAEDGAEDHVYDIGGPDVLTYLEMMQRYARAAGLRRRFVVPVPFLTPSLSSHWVHLVTPVPFGVAKPLVLGLSSEVVARRDGEDSAALATGPSLGYEQALRLALARVRDRDVETSWRDAETAGRSPAEPYPGDPDWTGGTLLVETHRATTTASPGRLYETVAGLGGDRGWPTFPWAWRVRGRLDRLVGGVGLRRGRRHPDDLRVGDALDFWRVEEARAPAGDHRPDGVVRLGAEMRMPGRAWLEFRVDPEAGGGAALTQRALFAPRGLLGRAYWFGLLPLHRPIFGSMARRLTREAGRAHQ